EAFPVRVQDAVEVLTHRLDELVDVVPAIIDIHATEDLEEVDRLDATQKIGHPLGVAPRRGLQYVFQVLGDGIFGRITGLQRQVRDGRPIGVADRDLLPGHTGLPVDLQDDIVTLEYLADVLDRQNPFGPRTDVHPVAHDTALRDLTWPRCTTGTW